MLILCHFDEFNTPQIFFKAPKSLDKRYLKEIPRLMINSQKKFFVHDLRGIKSANLMFEIQSQYSISRKERFLISVLITEGTINVENSQNLLKKFVKKFKEIKDAYKAFYINSESYAGDSIKYEIINNLFLTFYEKYSEDRFINRQEARVFIYGLSNAGKTSIIRSLQNLRSNNTLPTTNVDISKIIIKNISIFTFDAPGQAKYRKLWNSSLKNQDGLVFVFDITNKSQINEAREILHEIATLSTLKYVPLLILLNKIDLINFNIDELVSNLALEKFNERPTKYFLTSALTNENIVKAFHWLTTELLKKISLK